MKNLDLDINSYSINEIYNIVGVNKKSTLIEIQNACDSKKDKAIDLNLENKELFMKFIDECYKILSSITENKVVKNEYPYIKDENPKPVIEKLIESPQPNIQLVQNTNECNYNLNPITPTTIKQIVSINSLFRERDASLNYYGTTSDFVYVFPNEITNVVSMKLTSTEIPNTNYLIEDGNNSFSIMVRDPSAVQVETSYTITVPEGTWTSDDMVTFIQSYFDKDPAINTDLLRYLKMVLNGQTGKLLLRFKTDVEIGDMNTLYPTYGLTTTERDRLSYKLIQQSGTSVENPAACHDHYIEDNNILFVMGFSLNQTNKYITNSDTYQYGRTLFTGYLSAEHIYAHTLSTYYYVSINEFITNSKDQLMAFKRDGMISENILGRVQIKNSPFATNVDNNSDNVFKERNYFGNVKIRKIHVKILDKHGNVVNLNKSDVSLAIEFTQSYCSENQNNFSKSLFL